jgi:hypothetical protein
MENLTTHANLPLLKDEEVRRQLYYGNYDVEEEEDGLAIPCERESDDRQ